MHYSKDLTPGGNCFVHIHSYQSTHLKKAQVNNLMLRRTLQFPVQRRASNLHFVTKKKPNQNKKNVNVEVSKYEISKHETINYLFKILTITINILSTQDFNEFCH